jgi:hypothetical protein
MEGMRGKKGITRALLVSLGIPTVFFPGLILAAVLGWNWPRTTLTCSQILRVCVARARMRGKQEREEECEFNAG